MTSKFVGKTINMRGSEGRSILKDVKDFNEILYFSFDSLVGGYLMDTCAMLNLLEHIDDNFCNISKVIPRHISFWLFYFMVELDAWTMNHGYYDEFY